MPPGGPYPGYAGYAGPAPLPPAPRRTLWIVVGAVVVVVILVLAVLLVLGGGHTGSHHTGPITYSEAASDVGPVAQGYQGGGWKPILAEGLDSNVAATIPLPTNGSSTGTSGCVESLLVSTSTTFTLPSYTGSLSGGVAPGWLFGFVNASGSLLLAADLNGTVTLIATVGGPNCPLKTVVGFFAGIPSDVIDSNAAASAAWSVGGSAFVAAHPNALAVLALTSGVSFLGLSQPATWDVRYQACTASSVNSGQLVATFNATVNAATGRVISSQNSTQACLSTSITSIGSPGGPPPSTLGSDLSFATASESANGPNFWYNFSVQSAGGGITWSNVSLLVLNGSSIQTFGVTSYSVLSISGSVIVNSTGPLESSWTAVNGPPTTLISSTQTLSIETSKSLAGQGMMLEASGNDPSFAGTITAVIP